MKCPHANIRKTACLLLVAVAAVLRPVEASGPDRTTNWVQSDGAVVATAHPEASEIGLEMLRLGGNAVDAAIAAAYAIGVFEPTGSGIGGGGAAVVYIAADDTWHYVDFYQSAPLEPWTDFNSSEDLPGPKAVHIPGQVAGLEHMRAEWAVLDRTKHLQPAIDAARQGFVPGPVLLGVIRGQTFKMTVYPESRELFTNNGQPIEEGQVLRNPRLADAMELIAEHGVDVFYQGALTDTLVDRLNRYGGRFGREDFNTYQVRTQQPLHTTYRGFDIYSAAPPQSGVTVLQALNMMEQFDFSAHDHFSEEVLPLHLLIEILKRSFADRSAYLTDPEFAAMPVNGLISKAFAETRYAEIRHDQAYPADPRQTPSGNPWAFADVVRTGMTPLAGTAAVKGAGRGPEPLAAFTASQYASSPDNHPTDRETTTHISVIDQQGNMVALTSTIGLFFGSGVTVHGIPLNSSQTLFGGSPNHPEPLKRGRSTIAPTLIALDGQPFAALGAAGAARIIPAVLLAIHNVIDHGMDAWQANEAPRFLARKFHDRHEFESRISSFVIQDLIRKDHPVRVRQDMEMYFGGMQLALAPVGGLLEASSDPRRDGRPGALEREPTSVQYLRPEGSAEGDAGKRPDPFVLFGGYPNPFNAQAVLRFELRQAGAVQLEIYDALGRRVKQPINGQVLAAGTHEVMVDLSGHPTGIYVFRMVHDGMQQARSMLLVK